MAMTSEISQEKEETLINIFASTNNGRLFFIAQDVQKAWKRAKMYGYEFELFATSLHKWMQDQNKCGWRRVKKEIDCIRASLLLTPV